jgi:hypothetical protein
MPDDPPKLDLFQRFELEIRSPKRPMLLDAFLPPPESLESTVAPPPPPVIPEMPGEEIGALARLEAEEPPPEPKPRPARKKSRRAPAKTEAPRSLEQEIAEFMNRDQVGLSPDDDLDGFISSAIDPNVEPPADPDPKDGKKD